MQLSRKTKRASRAGRPPASSAGEVEERLLAAATHLFLTLGFEGTSCDQVAATAGAGKGSIYARYANKEELFAAVVHRMVHASVSSADDRSPDLPPAERLHAVGLHILERALDAEALAMTRIVIGMAGRLPALARLADQLGWEGAVGRVARAIAGRAGADDPDTIARAKPAAARFIALTFAPQQMRALLGDNPSVLRDAAPERIREAVRILTMEGWLDGWQ